jgi:hypothetical protein
VGVQEDLGRVRGAALVDVDQSRLQVPERPLQVGPGTLEVRLRLLDLHGQVSGALLALGEKAAELSLALGRGGCLLLGGGDLVGLGLDVRAHALGLRLRAGDLRVQVADALRAGGTGAEREERGGCHGGRDGGAQAVAAHGDAAGAWDWAVDLELHPSRRLRG